jgi:hypothetical protein
MAVRLEGINEEGGAFHYSTKVVLRDLSFTNIKPYIILI